MAILAPWLGGCGFSAAFGRHMEFKEDINPDTGNPYRRGSLYIVSTATGVPLFGQNFRT